MGNDHELNCHMNHFMAVHSYFEIYLHKLKQYDSPTYSNCIDYNETADHVLLSYPMAMKNGFYSKPTNGIKYKQGHSL